MSLRLSRDVVERLGRDARRGNSTQNHALSCYPRLVRLFQRYLLLLTTKDDFAASLRRKGGRKATEDGVLQKSLQRSVKTCFF